VIVPALANIADCSVVLQEGGVPIFADINIDDFNIDPESIKNKLTPRTKAIVIVHMYGQPARLEEIIKIAAKHRLYVIEVCAQAGWARYRQNYVGSFGDLSCFSFYQTKHLIAGEGGLIATSDPILFEKIRSLANNGIKRENLEEYNYDRIGYNYQMTEMQAALLSNQLKRINRLNRQRQINAQAYREFLSDTGIKFQQILPGTENAYFYLTGILPNDLATKRDLFLQILNKDGIPAKKLYPLSLPETDLFLRAKIGNCPRARDISKRLFNLYVNPSLSKKEIISLSRVIKKAYFLLKK